MNKTLTKKSIVLMKDKNLNILSPRTLNPLLTCVLVKLLNVQCSMLFNETVSIWLIRVTSPEYYFRNVMSQNLRSFLPPCPTMSDFADPLHPL